MPIAVRITILAIVAMTYLVNQSRGQDRFADYTNSDIAWTLCPPGYLLPIVRNSSAFHEACTKCTDKEILEGLKDDDRFIVSHIALCNRKKLAPVLHPAIVSGDTIAAIHGPLQISLQRRILHGQVIDTVVWADNDIDRERKSVAYFWIKSGGFWNADALQALTARDVSNTLRLNIDTVVARVKSIRSEGKLLDIDEIVQRLEEDVAFGRSDFGQLLFTVDDLLVRSVVHLARHGEFDSLAKVRLSPKGFAHLHLTLSQALAFEVVSFRGEQRNNGLTVVQDETGLVFPTIDQERASLVAFWVNVFHSE